MATLCFLLVLVLTSVAADSILDMIDTKAVERIVAERRANSSREFLLDNNSLLEEETTESILRNSTEDHQLQDILRRRGSSLLRSSKDALLVTRKEYLRRDWCKSEPLVQVVHEEGCSPVTVLNRFCYGQCNSFYIPKGPRRKGKSGKPDEDLSAFRSCAFCRPKISSWITVTLRCRKKKKTTIRRKKILRIKQCRCIAQSDNILG